MFSAMSVLANFLINNQPWLSGIWKTLVANLDEMKWILLWSRKIRFFDEKHGINFILAGTEKSYFGARSFLLWQYGQKYFTQHILPSIKAFSRKSCIFVHWSTSWRHVTRRVVDMFLEVQIPQLITMALKICQDRNVCNGIKQHKRC